MTENKIDFNYFNMISKENLPKYIDKYVLCAEQEGNNIKVFACILRKIGDVFHDIDLVSANYYSGMESERTAGRFYELKNKKYKKGFIK